MPRSATHPTLRLTGLSSMATRALLADLAAAYGARHGVALVIESVGGVDAAKRVQAGEAFDFVVLAADAIDRLIASGQLVVGSRADLVSSGVAVAVRSGSPGPDAGLDPAPDISTEDAVRRAVLAAPRTGYSTGPSGVQLLKLFDRWGITASLQLQGRLVQAPPGVPVAALLARGEVMLGFQQLSELLNVDGIRVLGPLPAAIQINTVFAAGLCTASTQVDAVRQLFDFLTSPAATPAKQDHGMAPA
jgi:molybdate transport system substrate-binding protein